MVSKRLKGFTTFTVVLDKTSNVTCLKVLLKIKVLLISLDNITSYKLKMSPVKTSKKAPKDDITFARYWIYSHHIYSNEKRRNMAQLYDELGLHGFVLPGKPGVICVEGVGDDVQEFYSHIRR